MSEYINFLNNSSKGLREDDDEEEPIEGALYQVMDFFTYLYESNITINCEQVVYFCILCTLLS